MSMELLDRKRQLAETLAPGLRTAPDEIFSDLVDASVQGFDRVLARFGLVLAPVDLSDPTVNAPGAARANSPETSKKAGLDVMPRTGTLRMEVLHEIALAGEQGRTHEELAERLGKNHYSVAPRCTELKDGGWVRDSGARRKTHNGSDAAVWILTEAGAQRYWSNGR